MPPFISQDDVAPRGATGSGIIKAEGNAMARIEGRTLRMDNYEFTKSMARGVTSGLFTFALLTGGVCFLVLSLFAWGFYIEDHGFSHALPPWQDFFHLIPWIIVVSLLFAIFFSPMGIQFGIGNTLGQMAKESQCRELSVQIGDNVRG